MSNDKRSLIGWRNCLGLFLSSVLMLVTLPANAQLKCNVLHYTTQHGLSHHRGTYVFKDTEGFVWTASWDGINRFDGNNFISYKSFPGDNYGLRSDRVDQINEDGNGYLWLRGTGFFYRFDKATEKFLPLSSIIKEVKQQNIYVTKVIANTNDFLWITTRNRGLFQLSQREYSKYIWHRRSDKQHYLPSDTVNFVFQDKSSKIWVGTTKGLVCLTRSKNGFYERSKSQPALSKAFNYKDYHEDSSRLYFSTKEGYLVIYNKETRNVIVKKVANAPLTAIRKSLFSSFIFCSTAKGDLVRISFPELEVKTTKVSPGVPILSIYEDRKGYLWLEPETTGIIRLSPKDGGFTWLGERGGDTYLSSYYNVFEDEDGTIWTSMKCGGFGYYNAETNRIERFYQEGLELRQFPDVVYNLYYDKAGMIWLCTENGIDKIIIHRNDFLHKSLVKNAKTTADQQVRGIYRDRKNRLWLGSKGGTLVVLDSDNKKIVSNLFVNEPAQGLGPIYSILQDSKGLIWIGTKYNGLFKAEPLNSEENRYKLTHYKTSNSRLTSDEIFTLYEDNDGRIWIGSLGGGINIALTKNGRTSFFNLQNAFNGYPKKHFRNVRHINADKSGVIWLATTDGLVLMNNQGRSIFNPKFKIYKKLHGDETSLAENDVQYIARDSENRMWLSTSGGLTLAIGSRPFNKLLFKNYTKENGLPSDYSVSVIPDKIGNLWIATENGLSRYNIRKNRFWNYDQSDGIPKVAFSEASCAMLNDGTLVFGTSKGYLMFNPQKIANKKTSPNIAITNIQVNNEDLSIKSKDSFPKLNANYINSLELRYNQNILSFDYAVLDYRSGAKQKFLYRLAGLTDVWSDNQSLRRVTYTNLAPGNYEFQVKVLNDDLYSKVPVKTLQVTILPPPWRTWWAFILYLILAGIIVRAGLRVTRTIFRLRQDVTIEKKLAELKVSFFTNVSHELRTPLTLILNPIEEIERREHLSEKGKEYLRMIKRNAGRMSRFMDQWLDLRKIQSGKEIIKISQVEIVSLVKSIADYFNDIRSRKNIDLRVVSNEEKLYAWVDAEKIDIVIYNLISNAFKYSPEGKTIRINIDCQRNTNRFIVEVVDEGGGVPEEKLRDIFGLFYSGHSASQHNDTKGIGIGLALSKELVELHNGTISARNNEYMGLTVTVELKLGKSHFSDSKVQFIETPAFDYYNSAVSESQLTDLPKEQVESDSKLPLVLLVEDNVELRSMLKMQLSEFYRIAAAVNGKEGLEKAIELSPDLILSDIMMPVMDGIRLLEALKKDERTSHIPVTLLSAKASIENQMEGLKYGADFYITKPFRPDYLLVALENLNKRRKVTFNSFLEKKSIIDLSPSEIIITSKDEEFLKKVIAIVEKGMTDPNFNIDKVGEGVGVGRTTFYNKFKSLTGLTTVEFVRDMRLKRAKQYLDAGETNISSVAYSSGFNNPKYFSTCFKEAFKVSPKEYVKNRELENM